MMARSKARIEQEIALGRMLAAALMACALCACAPLSHAPIPASTNAQAPWLQAGIRVDNCTAPPTRYCASCSAYCGCPQNQSAYCTRGIDLDGAGGKPGSCLQQAACSCQ
jgi:hypothetical protein